MKKGIIAEIEITCSDTKQADIRVEGPTQYIMAMLTVTIACYAKEMINAGASVDLVKETVHEALDIELGRQARS